MNTASKDMENGILYKSYLLSKHLCDIDNSHNWAHHVRALLSQYGLNNFWQSESIEGLSDATIKEAVQKYYVKQVWLPDLQRAQAKSGIGKNKLRTYCLFKKSFTMEEYLRITSDIGRRRAMAQLRTGGHSLPIETGRWERITGPDGKRGPRPAEERFCDSCDKEVIGDEIHWTIGCEGNRGEYKRFENIVLGLDEVDLVLDVEKPQDTFVSLMTTNNKLVWKAFLDFVFRITITREQKERV
jgi:hypothetical protein